MHTVVILAEYVNRNKLSDSAKGLLAQGLRTPSLGTWQLFSRVLFEELQHDSHNWMMPHFSADFSFLDKALKNTKTDVIAFRNGIAHGATPSDVQCERDILKYESFLNQLLQLSWLQKSEIKELDGRVFIKSTEGQLPLHPILLYRKEENDSPFAFFNDLKNDKVGLLNYPLGKHYREKDLWGEFHAHFPLHEWKKSGNNEFSQRIEQLTETFKGRTLEREMLLDFVLNKSKGYCSIRGNPGIGKSALIAQFFKDLRSNERVKNIQVVEYFIRRGTIQAQVDHLLNYFIKRTDDLFQKGREIRAEGKMTFELQNQLFSKWRMWGEHAKDEKVVFLIDGLDEGVENDVVKYLPRENFEHILIIYGSRPGGHKSIDDLWATLPPEDHTKIELAGLGKEDIRALIYEVANKYELDRESSWIDAVQNRSQGNPLYLKLLCDAIESGSIALNDVEALPDKIDDYYKAILDRYATDVQDGDALLAALFTFAAARDYLTMAHLGLINKLGDATVQRISSTLKEVLYENPLTEEVLDYQLFHESFREYLVKEYALKVRDASERIIEFCTTWRELEGTWEQRYTLQHYAVHAALSSNKARTTDLLILMVDKPYTETQKKVLKRFDASKELFRLCLLKTSELQKFDHQLTAALCLVDLKYEEDNDAQQVVSLVAAGEIDLALKRIESFGGVDIEGVKRRFILYMLCLMELTLLGSKDKSFRRTAIKKLQNHLEKHIPPDTSIIDWNDFFPSYTMFLMACQWAELNLNYLFVYARTAHWKDDWLSEKGPYRNTQFEILFECARGISNEEEKSNALSDISGELAKQGKIDKAASVMQEALECARGINNEKEKSNALSDISGELTKQGKIDEALECARGINNEKEKSNALSDISGELAKQGKIDKAASVMQEALESARGISDDLYKSRVVSYISSELTKQGKIDEALECARGISNEKEKSNALSDISGELAKQGKIDEAASAMQEALECARGISNEEEKSGALSYISGELAKQGKIEEALECARGISNEWQKSGALSYISGELAKQGKIEEALECARGISDDIQKSGALSDISGELAKQGKIDKAASAMQEALECARGISNEEEKSGALSYISGELTKQGKFDEAASAMQEALESVRGISDGWVMTSVLRDISTEFARQGKIDEALECARGISNEEEKSRALSDISGELAKQGKIDKAASAMQEALECARGISNEKEKSSALKDISIEVAKQGNGMIAENIGIEIPLLSERHSCWKSIAGNYYKQDGSKKALQQLNNLQSDEARLFYLKGWSAAVTVKEADVVCMQDVLSQVAHDSECIEDILTKHALHELFLGKPDKELIGRLNKTLNIQWALDIQARFPSSTQVERLYSNVDEWIHEVADEDDREDILGWAEKVKSGKMTEEKFEKNVKSKTSD